jgi:hypothetical protein
VVQWSILSTDRFTPGEKTSLPVSREAGWALDSALTLWRKENPFFISPGIYPRLVATRRGNLTVLLLARHVNCTGTFCTLLFLCGWKSWVVYRKVRMYCSIMGSEQGLLWHWVVIETGNYIILLGTVCHIRSSRNVSSVWLLSCVGPSFILNCCLAVLLCILSVAQTAVGRRRLLYFSPLFLLFA